MQKACMVCIHRWWSHHKQSHDTNCYLGISSTPERFHHLDTRTQNVLWRTT